MWIAFRLKAPAIILIWTCGLPGTPLRISNYRWWGKTYFKGIMPNGAAAQKSNGASTRK